VERAAIKRAKSRIDGSVRLASVLLSPLNHAITAERCLASPLGFQTSPIAAVGGPKCWEWVNAGGPALGESVQFRPSKPTIRHFKSIISSVPLSDIDAHVIISNLRL
jgi:hypothetical protein